MIASRALRAAAALRSLSRAVPRQPVALGPAAYVGSAGAAARFMAATATTTAPGTSKAAVAKVRFCVFRLLIWRSSVSCIACGFLVALHP